jgi:hypothetical protein
LQRKVDPEGDDNPLTAPFIRERGCPSGSAASWRVEDFSR